MTTERVTRKLAAVLHADVKGYSRLMRQDEIATVRALTASRELMAKLVELHRGRVVDMSGDAFLIEFPSVVDAVSCAVEFQREVNIRNADLPEALQMLFRVGINIGDVIQEGDQIYGDGVNIAARLQSIADVGGICISGSAYDQLKRKLALDYEFLGERTVKNISDPVRAYRILLESRQETPEERMSVQLLSGTRKKPALVVVAVAVACVAAVVIGYFATRPASGPAAVPAVRPAGPVPSALDRPAAPVKSAELSVAVLPFVNLSGDPGQDHFTDGMTEDLVSRLGKVPRLSVIASQSTFAYKGKTKVLAQIAKELGVRYVLEADIRKGSDRIEVSARLSDAVGGTELWNQRYDHGLNDLTSLLADIRSKVVQSLKVQLTDSEQARLRVLEPPPRTVAAYEKFLEGLGYVRHANKDDNAKARQMFDQAVALDPDYARAYAALARAHLADARFGWSSTPLESFQKALQFGRRSLALDNSLDMGLLTVGSIYLRQRDYDKAVSTLQQAISVNQSGADAYAALGSVLVYAGRAEEAIQVLSKAIRLNPISPPRYLVALGDAYRGAGRYEEALAAYKRALERQPANMEALTGLAATYSLSGRHEEARAAATELDRHAPRFSLERFARSHPYRNREQLDLIMEALRNAGLK